MDVEFSGDPIPMTGLRILPSELELYVGESEEIMAKVVPENTTERYNITYQSADTEILDYDETQNCWVAKKAGITSVTSTVFDRVGEERYTAECKVKVKEKIIIEDMEDIHIQVCTNEYADLGSVPIPQKLQDFATKNNLVCNWKYPKTALAKYVGGSLPAECVWSTKDSETEDIYECESVIVTVSPFTVTGYDVIFKQSDKIVDTLELIKGQENSAKIELKPLLDGCSETSEISFKYECYEKIGNSNFAITGELTSPIYEIEPSATSKEGKKM